MPELAHTEPGHLPQPQPQTGQVVQPGQAQPAPAQTGAIAQPTTGGLSKP